MKCSSISYLEVHLLSLAMERTIGLAKKLPAVLDPRIRRKDLSGIDALIYDTYWLNRDIKRIIEEKLLDRN